MGNEGNISNALLSLSLEALSDWENKCEKNTSKACTVKKSSLLWDLVVDPYFLFLFIFFSHFGKSDFV